MLTTLLAAVVLAAVAAAPAWADVAGADPPDVVLEEDGTLVFDGDLATDCRSFAGGVERGELYGADDPEQARSALEQCEEAGLLPPKSITPSASTSASAPAPSEVSAADGAGALPETGGPALPALVVFSGVLATAGGLLLARRVAAE